MARRKHSFDEILDLASREADTTAVWHSLSIEDREKALRRLFGPEWREKKKAAIERWERQFR